MAQKQGSNRGLCWNEVVKSKEMKFEETASDLIHDVASRDPCWVVPGSYWTTISLKENTFRIMNQKAIEYIFPCNFHIFSVGYK